MKISVVIATFNRGELLRDLLEDLVDQEDPGPFEVVLVDDGSKVPARQVVESRSWPYPLKLIEQANAGQAKARHRGIMEATGDIVVITDDDMALAPRYLAAHRALHESGVEVVLGLMRPATDLGQKPIFERFHAQQLDLFVREVRAGKPIPGSALCTGNVSFRRARYLQLGGFDPNLQRSEDRDLGIRLQEAGARFAFSEDAYTEHRSDHTSREIWMRRAFLYGVYDHRIGQKHPRDARNNPWHYMLLVNPISRPLLLATVLAPSVGQLLSKQAMHTSELLDRAGLENIAIKGATLVFGLEYFRGVRSEYASSLSALRGFARFLTGRRGGTQANA